MVGPYKKSTRHIWTSIYRVPPLKVRFMAICRPFLYVEVWPKKEISTYEIFLIAVRFIRVRADFSGL